MNECLLQYPPVLTINMKNELKSLPTEYIEQSIYIIQGQKVMLDSDLANLYGVLTKNLNKAVKRNIDCFPEDFMFQLSENEWNYLNEKVLRFQIGTSNNSHLRSQIVTSKKGRGGNRYLPYAFTKQGIAMLSSVLRSPQAIAVNIEIMRAFVKMRHLFASHQKLSKEMEEIKAFLLKNSQQNTVEFRKIWKAIDQLAHPPEEGRKIGFRLK